MTASILARVASLTKGDWLITRETVFFDTLASRAMSLMVALRPLRLSAPFHPAPSGVVPLVPDVLVLGMLVVLAPCVRCKGCRSVRVKRGLDKRRPAPLNDTGFPRQERCSAQLSRAEPLIRSMQTHFTPAVHRIDPDDDVAVALRQLEPGETVALGNPGDSGSACLYVRELIPRGHKLAIRKISAGSPVRKYGWLI